MLRIPLEIQHLNELTAGVWIILYETLFQTVLVDEDPLLPLRESQRRHLQAIHRTLEQNVIRMDLSHLSVDAWMAGDRLTLVLWLDVFLELARAILSSSSEGAAASPNGRGDAAKEFVPAREEWMSPLPSSKWMAASPPQSIRGSPNPTNPTEQRAPTEPKPSSSAAHRKPALKPSDSLSQLIDDIPARIPRLSTMEDSIAERYPGEEQVRVLLGESKPPKSSPYKPTPITSTDYRIDSLQKTHRVLQEKYRKATRLPKSAAPAYRARTIRSKTKGKPKPATVSGARSATTHLGKDLAQKEAARSMRNITRVIENTLPGVDIPDWIRTSAWKKQVSSWDKILKDAKLEERMAAIRLGHVAEAEQEALKPVDMAEQKVIRNERRVLFPGQETTRAPLLPPSEQNFFDTIDRTQRAAASSLQNRHRAVVRLTQRVQDIEKDAQSYLLRRRDTEERLVKRMMDETLQQQRDAILTLRKYRKEEEERAVRDKLVQAEARRNYLRDQVEMMEEELRKARHEDQLREKNLREELFRARREQKQALKERIATVRGRLRTDGMDFYFREKDVQAEQERRGARKE